MQWPLALVLLHLESMRMAHAFMKSAPRLGNGARPQRCTCWLPLVTLLPRRGSQPAAPASLAAAGSGQGFAPVERELVFDIDLTDYDDVRTCGKEGHICGKCWPLMAAAIKVRGWLAGKLSCHSCGCGCAGLGRLCMSSSWALQSA